MGKQGERIFHVLNVGTDPYVCPVIYDEMAFFRGSTLIFMAKIQNRLLNARDRQRQDWQNRLERHFGVLSR